MSAMNFWASLGYHGTTLRTLTAMTPQIVAGLIIYLIVCVIGIVGIWKIFTKAGEPGWKALIPFYNVYTLCKVTWRTDFFWIQLFCASVAFFTSTMQTLPMPFKAIFGLASVIAGVFCVVLAVIGNYRIAKSFNHGAGFTVGLLILPFIFTLILGFGKDEYIGNVYLKENK